MAIPDCKVLPHNLSTRFANFLILDCLKFLNVLFFFSFYLGEKHVADRKDWLDAAKELLLFLVANGTEFPQRSGVDVVDGPQTDEKFALGVDQVLRQSKPGIRFCNERINSNKKNTCIRKWNDME